MVSSPLAAAPMYAKRLLLLPPTTYLGVVELHEVRLHQVGALPYARALPHAWRPPPCTAAAPPPQHTYLRVIELHEVRLHQVGALGYVAQREGAVVVAEGGQVLPVRRKQVHDGIGGGGARAGCVGKWGGGWYEQHAQAEARAPAARAGGERTPGAE